MAKNLTLTSRTGRFQKGGMKPAPRHPNRHSMSTKKQDLNESRMKTLN